MANKIERASDGDDRIVLAAELKSARLGSSITFDGEEVVVDDGAGVVGGCVVVGISVVVVVGAEVGLTGIVLMPVSSGHCGASDPMGGILVPTGHFEFESGP